MRHLGENFGYNIPVAPLTGRVEGKCITGDRRTSIWTLQTKKRPEQKWPKPHSNNLKVELKILYAYQIQY